MLIVSEVLSTEVIFSLKQALEGYLIMVRDALLLKSACKARLNSLRFTVCIFTLGSKLELCSSFACQLNLYELLLNMVVCEAGKHICLNTVKVYGSKYLLQCFLENRHVSK